MTYRKPLRSDAWTVGDDEVAMSHRVALRLTARDAGRPVIGIADTSSALNPCNVGFARLIEHIETGIREAGGVPVCFPTMSLGEDLMKPSAMLYRNLVAMELEEMVRANPLDGVVYLANCDKSVPAAIMAAASTDLPSLILLGGSRSAPMFRGRPLGTGTDLWRALDDRRGGRLDDEEWSELEGILRCAGSGACNTMGTASTMAILTEVLGMALPGSACLPASGPELEGCARDTGAAVVAHVTNDFKPSMRLTQAALDNSATALAAIGGSTNAVIHLAAIAGRLGLDASLARMDRIWTNIPLVVDVEPCGSALVHDFRRAGGTPTLMRSIAVHTDLTVTAADGRPWQAIISTAAEPGGVIRACADPLAPPPVLASIFGSLAPDGAVLKVAAASPQLLHHRGRAVVFDNYAAMRERLDDDSDAISAEDVLIIRGCGPRAVPGMPEWGMAPLPAPLVRRGVTDMLRVTDGRMSGTSFGTVVLHVAPEADLGGQLALVEDGDEIALDLDLRRLDLLVDEETLSQRRRKWVPPLHADRRGWPRLYRDHVQQAPQGCDLDFLVSDGHPFVEPVVGRS